LSTRRKLFLPSGEDGISDRLSTSRMRSPTVAQFWHATKRRLARKGDHFLKDENG
jgi:hypothetical protein